MGRESAITSSQCCRGSVMASHTIPLEGHRTRNFCGSGRKSHRRSPNPSWWLEVGLWNHHVSSLIIVFHLESRRIIIIWLVVSTPLKNIRIIRQLEIFFPIYGKIKNVPSHQPVIVNHQSSSIIYNHYDHPPFQVRWNIEKWGNNKSVKKHTFWKQSGSQMKFQRTAEETEE